MEIMKNARKLVENRFSHILVDELLPSHSNQSPANERRKDERRKHEYMNYKFIEKPMC